MSVVEVLIGVIAMQLATTIMGVTPALATLDTQAMGFLAQVSASRLLIIHTVRYQVMTASVSQFCKCLEVLIMVTSSLIPTPYPHMRKIA